MGSPPTFCTHSGGLPRFRRVVVFYERNLLMFQAFIHVACPFIIIVMQP